LVKKKLVEKFDFNSELVKEELIQLKVEPQVGKEVGPLAGRKVGREEVGREEVGQEEVGQEEVGREV
jgi:hypothetical protein